MSDNDSVAKDIVHHLITENNETRTSRIIRETVAAIFPHEKQMFCFCCTSIMVFAEGTRTFCSHCNTSWTYDGTWEQLRPSNIY